MFVKEGETTRTVPVTEAKILSLVTREKLRARAVASKVGCYDTIEYTLARRAA